MARGARCLLVAADRVDIATQTRVIQQIPCYRRNADQGNRTGVWNTQNGALSPDDEVTQLVSSPAAGQHERRAARCGQHGQCRDEWRRLELGDDQAIDDAATHADEDTNRQRCAHHAGGLEEHHQIRPASAITEPGREVDQAQNDQDRLAEGEGRS